MHQHLVFISGALATPEFWNQQELTLKHNAKITHVTPSGLDSISAMSRDFAQQSPEEFVLIAFSMGGYVALNLFDLIPERIKGLVLINSSARAVPDKGVKERLRLIELIKKKYFQRLLQVIFQDSVYEKNKQEIIIDKLKKMAKQVGSMNYLKQLNAIITKPEQSSLLNKIQCPTLILASQNDEVMPPERSEHLAKNILKAELKTIDCCGHAAPMEQPEVINKHIMEFLKGL